MKNKGFTLVEIISALIILAILLVVAIPGVNGIQKSLKNNMYCNKIGSIEAAAKLYGQDFVDEIEQAGYKNVSIKTLIDNNLIEKEDNDCVSGSADKPCLADPRDNSSLDSNNVRIFKKGDRITAYYVYETSDDINMCGGKDEEEMKGQAETIKLINGTNLTRQGQDSISVKFGDKFPDITQLPQKNYRVKLLDNYEGTEKVIKEETIKHELKGYYLTQNEGSSQYYSISGDRATSNEIFKDAHVNTLYAHWNYTSYRLPNLDGPNARTGYIVEGWYIKDTQIKVGSVGSNYIPTKDNIVLVAKWIPQRRTITLDEDIPNGEKTTIIAQYDSDLPKLDKIPSKTYTITFNPNGGTVSPTTSTSVYTFQGYYSDHNGKGTKYINADGTSARKWDSTTIQTLYAHWTKTSATFPNATRTGYTFLGWYTAASGGSKVGNAGTTLVLNENKTVYAHWKANDYTVTLNNQSATGSGTTSITATYDSNMPNISIPSRSYTVSYNGNGGSVSQSSATSTYTFSGYYSGTNGTGTKYINSNGTSARTWNIASNTTLYAKWTGGNVSLPSASRTGYTFAGWYTAASGGAKVGNAGSSYNPTSNTTLYAHWTANKYTVTLNNQSATSAGSTSLTATYDSALPSITKPSRSYSVSYNANGGSVSPTSTTSTYTFGGYYTSTNGGGTQYINANGTSARNWNIASNTTLYAKWTGGGITLPTPTRTGYTFNGWYNAASGGSKIGNAGASYSPSSNITLYAHWTPNTNTVWLDQQGGWNGTGSITATYDNAMPNISIPQRGYSITFVYNVYGWANTTSQSTYTFNGYYTGGSGTGTKYYNNNGTSARTWNLTSNVTLYAYWTGGNIATPNPTRNGYTFQGWNNESGSRVSNPGGALTPTSNMNLYGAWSANQYTVWLDQQGGWNGTGAVTATFDQGMPGASAPTRTGYRFNGYYTGTNGTGTRYYNENMQSERNYDLPYNVTLYAHWIPSTYNVWLDKQGGSGGSDTSTPTYGSSMPGISVPSRSYTVTFNYNGNGQGNSYATATYTFNGYYSGANGTGTKYYNADGTSARSYDLTSNITLYAYWTAGSVTLPSASWSNHQMLGWFTSASGGTKVGDAGASYLPAANITFYAAWKVTDCYLTHGGGGFEGHYNANGRLDACYFTGSSCMHQGLYYNGTGPKCSLSICTANEYQPFIYGEDYCRGISIYGETYRGGGLPSTYKCDGTSPWPTYSKYLTLNLANLSCTAYVNGYAIAGPGYAGHTASVQMGIPDSGSVTFTYSGCGSRISCDSGYSASGFSSSITVRAGSGNGSCTIQ